MPKPTTPNLKPCPAGVWHGPDWSQLTACQLTGRHETHMARYGEAGQIARWRGKGDVRTGDRNEPPPLCKPKASAILPGENASPAREADGIPVHCACDERAIS